MTDQIPTETNQTAMPVISYAPVENEQSTSRLFRQAVAWFLILEFGWWALSEITRYVSMFLLTPTNFPTFRSANDYVSLIFMTARFSCYCGLVWAGFLLLKKSTNSLRMIRILLVCYMVLSIVVQIIMAVTFAIEIYQGDRSYRIELLISSLLSIPGSVVMPLFLLILTSPKIAAIYK